MLRVRGCMRGVRGRSAQAADRLRRPAANSNDFACGHLTVPLDPSGAHAGRRSRSRCAATARRSAKSSSAVIALAGGPGQPALPFAEQFAQAARPDRRHARPDRLRPARHRAVAPTLLPRASNRRSTTARRGRAIDECARAARTRRAAFYTTADTVADIEAIRQAGGYEKLVLYGTSYGTKVAEQYAQELSRATSKRWCSTRSCRRTGPNRSTARRSPRCRAILRQLCADRACAHITRNPVADLARARRARCDAARCAGAVIDGHGRAHSGAHLLRRAARNPARGRPRTDPARRIPGGRPLGARTATTRRSRACSSAREARRKRSRSGRQRDLRRRRSTTRRPAKSRAFPWSRAVGRRATRIAEASARASSALGPRARSRRSRAATRSRSATSRRAPSGRTRTPPPAPDEAPLPDVPTLILSGADDLRTPTANAREVAAQIPDAHLLVVPNTGHSVLGTEPTRLRAATRCRRCSRTRPIRAVPRPPACRRCCA